MLITHHGSGSYICYGDSSSLPSVLEKRRSVEHPNGSHTGGFLG